MNTVEIKKVIVTTLARRGDGIKDPIRVITQYWNIDGSLIFEIDPKDDLKDDPIVNRVMY